MYQAPVVQTAKISLVSFILVFKVLYLVLQLA